MATQTRNPLVSICIPAYNAERFIEETLESALAQSYAPIELIVSDDGSTDCTRAIVKRLASRGVQLVTQPHNLGMFGNFNAVIRASSGKYVVKLDADDLIEPDYCSQMVAVMEQYPDVVFAHCACRLIDLDGGSFGYERSIQGSFIRNGAEEWPRYTLGPKAVNIVAIRRQTFDEIGGYDERYAYSGDWALHRALLRRGSVFYNDKVLASYRVHSVGKEGVKLIQARERLMHLESMEHDWPDIVPSKTRLLRRAHHYHAQQVALSAAYAGEHERAEILAVLPGYDSSLRTKLLAAVVRRGGSGVVRRYYDSQMALRQLVKSRLYQKS